MSQPYKIALAGIGGIGGYYGGLLAHTYIGSTDIQIYFIARGGHMAAIKEKGLQLSRDTGDIICHPHSVTDNPKELGDLDLIVFCCKAYDLEKLASSFATNITKDTVLLPLLNGVDSTDILQKLYPQAKTLYGCTYLFSKIVGEGAVKVTGDLNNLLFGHPDADEKEIERIAAIFSATGTNVTTPEDIKQKLWEKFSFISPMATATTAFNTTVDQILNDREKRTVLSGLMQEIVQVAKAENVMLPDDILEINMGKLEKLHAGATSSMHNDFKNNKNTELETLTGYVVRQAQKHNKNIPGYMERYTFLKSKVRS